MNINEAICEDATTDSRIILFPIIDYSKYFESEARKYVRIEAEAIRKSKEKK